VARITAHLHGTLRPPRSLHCDPDFRPANGGHEVSSTSPLPTHCYTSATSFYLNALEMFRIKTRMKKRGKNVHAAQLARQRWSKVPKNERAMQVPRSGGRPRKYPKCRRYGSHRFSSQTGRCPCGFSRPLNK